MGGRTGLGRPFCVGPPALSCGAAGGTCPCPAMAQRDDSLLGRLSPRALSSLRPGRWREGVVSLCTPTRGVCTGSQLLLAHTSGVATPRSSCGSKGCRGRAEWFTDTSQLIQRCFCQMCSSVLVRLGVVDPCESSRSFPEDVDVMLGMGLWTLVMVWLYLVPLQFITLTVLLLAPVHCSGCYSRVFLATGDPVTLFSRYGECGVLAKSHPSCISVPDTRRSPRPARAGVGWFPLLAARGLRCGECGSRGVVLGAPRELQGRGDRYGRAGYSPGLSTGKVLGGRCVSVCVQSPSQLLHALFQIHGTQIRISRAHTFWVMPNFS